MNELSSTVELKSEIENLSPEKGFYSDSERPTENSFQPRGLNLNDTGKQYYDSERDIGCEPLKETTEEPEKKGGSYGEIFKDGEGDKFEVHHMPADSVSPLERNDGPAIKMEKEDHRLTASCGNSLEAREYREAQKELIEQGNFREAIQMDIDDIKEKFGDKYDDAIAEMLKYVDKLEMEGKINE